MFISLPMHLLVSVYHLTVFALVLLQATESQPSSWHAVLGCRWLAVSTSCFSCDITSWKYQDIRSSTWSASGVCRSAQITGRWWASDTDWQTHLGCSQAPAPVFYFYFLLCFLMLTLLTILLRGWDQGFQMLGCFPTLTHRSCDTECRQWALWL